MQVELIEFHDARVCRLTISAGGEVLLEFQHITVYERLADRCAYQVASYSAELRLSGTTSIGIHGRLDNRSRVVDLKRSDSELTRGDTESMWLQPMPGGAVALTFENGASIAVQCETLGLKLVDRVRTLEIWEGPLSSQD